MINNIDIEQVKKQITQLRKGMIPKKEEFFLMFGVTTPNFPERFFGGAFIRKIWKIQRNIVGTALVIGGGKLDCKNKEHQEWLILPRGSIQVVTSPFGKRFCERVIAELAKPLERVILVINVIPTWTSLGWEARDAGFEVIETQSAIVCIGNGSMLQSFQWLETVNPCVETSAFAFDKINHPFEANIINIAKSGQDIIAALDYFWYSIYQNQEVPILEKQLKGFRLVTSLGGVECGDIFVNVSNTDTKGLRNILKQIGKDLNIILFDAGNIEDIEKTSYFDGREEWITLPQEWILVT
jgi:hypothetical protein